MTLPAIALWVFCLAVAGTSHATVSHEEFSFTIEGGGVASVFSFQDLAEASQTVVIPDETSHTTILTNGSITRSEYTLGWEQLKYDSDPYITFVGSFSNNMGLATDFTLSMLASVVPLSDTLIGGSTIVTVADASLSGTATIKNIAGRAGYSGSLDGVDVLDLLDPFSATVPFMGGTAFATETDGLPGPTIPGGAVTDTIGITHRFNLTSGDNATFNSTFLVVTPEPSTALLTGLGILGLAFARQRRA